MSTHGDAPAGVVSLETIAAVLAPFRCNLSVGQLGAVQEYLRLLLQWNKSISLTAIEDPVEILSRHFGESLYALSLFNLGESRLADVGTGAGFPGLPLRIACPSMKLTLFESNLKKCAFLTEVAHRLDLAGIEVQRQRYEQFGGGGEGFDFVCARALGDYQILLPWSSRVLKPRGRVLLWLGTEESIRLSRRKEFVWEVPAPIPESRRRVILSGRQVGG